MKINSGIRDYEVRFEATGEFLSGFGRFPQRCFVVDSNVWRMHSGGLLAPLRSEAPLILPVDEERKTLATVQEIYDSLTERSAKRNMTMIVIGGGTLQDICGFAASTLYRGIPWVFVPTTLLAQADSCIGSKTSLNYRRFKNLLGTFYPPSEVHIHAPFLRTLAGADFLSGLGEVVKLHLMGGAGATEALSRSLPEILGREDEPLLSAIRRSLEIKWSYMDGDEFDLGKRNLLNFGHCFGHALETVSGYAIPHGQAVVVGMVFAGIAARNRGLLSAGNHARIVESLLVPALKEAPRPEHLAFAPILEAMRQDKKRTGDGLALVMLTDTGELVKVTDFSADELGSALAEIASLSLSSHSSP
jgi:3-dehydroquinate synthase